MDASRWERLTEDLVLMCGATQDKQVMVERSDRMQCTGEGNGKPLQYSCLESPMNTLNY